MSQFFTPEHFNTSARLGVSFEGEHPEAEVLGEIDLILDDLLGSYEEKLTLSREDLEAYHHLQYGGIRGAGRFAMSLVMSGDTQRFIRSDKVRSALSLMEQTLPRILASHTDRIIEPLPLGRFPLNPHPIGSTPAELWLPDDFAGFFDDAVPASPIQARNPGPFLYPRDGVTLNYVGTANTDTSFGQLMFNELSQYNPALVERCVPNINRSDLTYPDDMPELYLDEIIVEEDGTNQSFIAISSESVLLAVEPAVPFGFED